MTGVRIEKAVRPYLAVICALRTILLGAAMLKGFYLLFPNTNTAIHLFLFVGLLIFHWITVIFYEIVPQTIIAGAFFVDAVFCIGSKWYIIASFGPISLMETICFGNIAFILADIFFAGITIFGIAISKGPTRKI